MYILDDLYTSTKLMRLNIDIDDDLLAEAMAATGATTKRATVEEALRTLIRAHDPAYLAELLRSIRDENGGNVQGAS